MGDVDRHLRVDGGDLELKLVAASQADLTLDVSDGVAAPLYEGGYEVTPTREGFVLSTSGLRMAEDLRVNPIPSNWGLISWDGSALTVS